MKILQGMHLYPLLTLYGGCALCSGTLPTRPDHESIPQLRLQFGSCVFPYNKTDNSNGRYVNAEQSEDGVV
jgi:hypothetical protein